MGGAASLRASVGFGPLCPPAVSATHRSVPFRTSAFVLGWPRQGLPLWRHLDTAASVVSGGDIRDRNRRTRSLARSLRSSESPVAPRLVRHDLDRAGQDTVAIALMPASAEGVPSEWRARARRRRFWRQRCARSHPPGTLAVHRRGGPRCAADRAGRPPRAASPTPAAEDTHRPARCLRP